MPGRPGSPPREALPRADVGARPGGAPAALRAFFAIFPSQDVERELSAYVGGLRDALRGVSWVKPGNLHLTLRFFGELAEEHVAAAAAAAREVLAAGSSFRLRFGDPGAFPSTHSPRVVWLGVDRKSVV